MPATSFSMDNHSHLLIRRFSQALVRHVRLIALVPEGPGGPWPAALLLHGMCDDESTWLRRTALERHVLGRGLAVIIPDGERGWWRDDLEGRFAALALETCDYARDLLPLRVGRWGILGNSMGGYGALRLGLVHPERFSSIVAIAPAVELDRHRGDAALHPIDPAEEPPALATAMLTHPRRPALNLLCGDEDPLLPEVLAFDRHLTSVGYPHTCQQMAGGHFWDAWDRCLPVALDALMHGLDRTASRDST